MAKTLVDAAKLSNDVLQAGVIELIVKDDPIFAMIPFKDIVGNGLTYNVETTEATAQFYSVGDTWVESTGTTTQTTATLKILGGDSDVDNFLLETRSNINDLKQEALEAKIKAVKKEFMDEFFYGHTTLDAKGFNGLHELVENETYNTVAVGGTSGNPAALSMTKLEEGIDKVKGIKPQMLVMSKLMRRSINTYKQAAGGITYTDLGNRRVMELFELPVYACDFVGDTENILHAYASTYGYDNDVTTADDGTSIFVLSFAPQACCGIQKGPLTIESFPKLETKDASRYRIKWYVSLMLQNILTCAKVTGIDPDGTVVV